MNKEQAIEALKQGKKLTHRFFLETEFIYLKEGILYDEENVNLGHPDLNAEFWQIRRAKNWDSDWTIYSNPTTYPVYLRVNDVEMIKILGITRFQIARLGQETSLTNHDVNEAVVKDLLSSGLKLSDEDSWNKFIGVVRAKLMDVKLI